MVNNDEDELFQDFDDSPDEVLERLLVDLKTRGANIAYQALLDVAANPAAPPPARATAGGLIFRAAGLLAKDDDRGSTLEPHQMSAAQLEREAKRLERLRKSLQAKPAGGVFD